jgi:hypothetical protein
MVETRRSTLSSMALFYPKRKQQSQSEDQKKKPINAMHCHPWRS